MTVVVGSREPPAVRGAVPGDFVPSDSAQCPEDVRADAELAAWLLPDEGAVEEPEISSAAVFSERKPRFFTSAIIHRATRAGVGGGTGRSSRRRAIVQ